MPSIAHIDAVIATLLGEHADKIARQTRFVQRQSPITGSVFAQTLIYGFLALPDASYSHLQIVAASRGVCVSSSAWEQRMTQEAVEFLWHLLTNFLGMVLTHEPVALDLFTRFHGCVCRTAPPSVCLRPCTRTGKAVEAALRRVEPAA